MTQCDCPLCSALDETLNLCDENSLEPEEVMQLAVELMKVAIEYQLKTESAGESVSVRRMSMQ